jgi:hypothetical protein
MSDDTFTQAWRISIPDFQPLFKVVVRSPDGDTWIEWSPAFGKQYPAVEEVPTAGPGRVINAGVPYVSTKWLREHYPADKDLQDFLVGLVARVDVAVAELEAKRRGN